MKHVKLRKITAAVLLLIFSALTLASCSGGAPDANGAMMGGAMYGDGAMVPDADNSGENYTEIIENAFVSSSENNTSYFSIDANTASYPNLRDMIRDGYTVPANAVRIEEMLNYFDYDYDTPTDGSILALSSSVFDNPYNRETKLLTIGLAAQEIEFDGIRNNLVFLIDTSGSMYSDDKLPLVQQAFMLLAENLNPTDVVSIVTYAGDDSVALEGAYGYETHKIIAAIEDLTAGGSTAGSDGINTAYSLAEKYFIEGGNNRVILATDGDFNVGVVDEGGLESLISEKRASGVYFSVYGFGRGNIQSSKMETLALNGNGAYGYIDSVNEARRALVSEIGGSMVTVAKDVKAGVIFNPDYIESFRLIGYENKLLTEDEFNDESTDAGELGSGHTVTVVYEVKLTDKELVPDENLAQVTVKYKTADEAAESRETLIDIKTGAYHSEMTARDAFISSVIEFGLILRNSSYKADAGINTLVARLESLDLTSDEFKAEFRDIVKLYQQNIISKQ